MADNMTTLPISTEVNELVLRLAEKKAKDLNLPRLSRTAYAEMVFRNLAEDELTEK